jgi:energy-coupling factor transport system permease protein
MPPPGARAPRLLHPAAWWLWAVCLCVAASRTTNPFLLLLIVAVAAWVVVERREPGQSNILVAFLAVGAAAIVLRLLMTTVLGGGVTGRIVVLRLPEIPLPEWASSIRLGGEVTLEALAATAAEALQLAAILACLGAANALAGPRRLLRYVPATLYDVGAALVVGLTYAPQLVHDAVRVRRARQLRGHSGRGPAEFAKLAVPVLSGALEGALGLAASMETRGYGRAGQRDVRRQRRASAATIVGLIGLVAGLYGVLDGTTPAIFGVPLVVGGAALAATALVLGAGRDRRTHYRRDRWAAPEWAVVTLGLVAAGVLVAAQQGAWPGITPPQMPLEIPGMPLPAVLAILAAGLVAVVTPAPPVARRPTAGGPR